MKISSRWVPGIGITALAFFASLSCRAADNAQAVAAYRESLQQKGESLDVGSLQPKPAASNDLAAACIALAKSPQFQNILLPLPMAPLDERGRTEILAIKSRPVFRKETSPSPSWADVSKSLAGFGLQAGKLQELARKPNEGLTFEYRSGYEMSTPGLGEMARTISFFASRGIVAIRDKDLDSAVTEVETLLLLSKIASQQPIMLAQLVAAAGVRSGAQVTWQLLQTESPGEARLKRLQSAWQAVDIANTIPATLRMERAATLSTFSLPPEELTAKLEKMPGFNPANHEKFSALVRQWSTVRAPDDLFYLQNTQNLIDLSTAAVKSGTWSQVVEGAEKLEFRSGRPSDKLMSAIALPTMASSVPAIVEAQAIARLTSVAIAIEQYRLSKKSLPLTLQSLVPEFLPTAPKDPFDGKPLRYQRENDNDFVLYSVGKNLSDEKGSARKLDPSEKDGLREDTVWPHPIRAVMQ